MGTSIERSVNVPSTWGMLLATNISKHPLKPVYTKISINDPQMFQYDRRVIPIILDGYYSAELVIYSDDLSYYCRAYLKLCNKTVDESTAWTRLNHVVLRDFGNEFIINMKWCDCTR